MSRALLLAPTVPCPSGRGGNAMTWALLRALARRHELDVLTFSESSRDEESLPGVKELCARVEVVPLSIHRDVLGWRYPLLLLRTALSRSAWPVVKHRSRRMAELVATRARERAYDVIHADHLCMAQFIPSWYRGPTVLHEHNAEHVLMQRYSQVASSRAARAFARLEAAKLRRYERGVCSRVSMVWTLGAHEREVLERLTGGRARVRVTPMALDTGYWRPPRSCRREPWLITFAGTLHYRPNADAALWLGREIFPRVRAALPQARLHVVGSRPGAEVLALADPPSVEVTGFVDDLRPLLARSAAVVAPLRFGAGVKIKTVVALSMGAALVTTPVGAEGLEIRDGREALVAEGAREFADRLVELLRDRALQRRLGRAGRALAVRRHSQEALERCVAGLCDELEERPR